MDWTMVGIVAGIASGLIGTCLGIWARIDEWKEGKRNRQIAEREDRDYEAQKSAALRLRLANISGYGTVSFYMWNIGNHVAEITAFSASIGNDEYQLAHEGRILSADQNGISMDFDIRPESKKHRGTYKTTDMAHLPPEALVAVSYADGLGTHERKWKIQFKRSGERLVDWDIEVQALEA